MLIKSITESLRLLLVIFLNNLKTDGIYIFGCNISWNLPSVLDIHDLQGIHKHKRQESSSTKHEFSSAFALRGSYLSFQVFDGRNSIMRCDDRHWFHSGTGNN